MSGRAYSRTSEAAERLGRRDEISRPDTKTVPATGCVADMLARELGLDALRFSDYPTMQSVHCRDKNFAFPVHGIRPVFNAA